MHALVIATAFLIQAVAPKQTGFIGGRLHLAETAGPPPVVRVAAIPAAEAGVPAVDSTLLGIAETDPSGTFRLEGLPPGRYYIMAGALARPTYYPGVTSISEARVVTVTTGGAVTGVDFALQNTRTAVPGMVTRVQGVVVTNNGNAIPSSLSVVTQQRSGSGVARTTRGPGTMRMPRATGVGPDGRFQLQLSDGEHSLHLTNLPSRYVVESISYGSVDLLNALLKVGSSTPDSVRITLREVRPERVFKVSGRVSALDSYWFRRSRIRLRPDVNPGVPGDPYPPGQIELPMNADGTFEITGVVPGQYLLIPLGIETTGVQGTPITVEDHDLRDVEVPLPSSADVIVSIRFIDENENLLPNPSDYNTIRMELSNPHYASVGGLRRLVREGSYSVSLTQLPPGYVLKSITSGGHDLSQTPLNVDLASTTINIEATLQKR